MQTARSRTILIGMVALTALVAGCNRNRNAEAPAAPPPSTAEAPGEAPKVVTQAPPPVSEGPALTAYGWGDVTVGMAEGEALAAGLQQTGSGKPGPECHFLNSPKEPGLLVMIEDGKVSRVSLRENRAIRTDKGLGVGATADQVRAAYGSDIEPSPHKYDQAPAGYLTHWTLPGKRGVRYVLDGKGLVSEIHGGGPSIQYVEGCS